MPFVRCFDAASRPIAMDFDSMDESLAKTLQSFVEVISQKDGKSEEDRCVSFSYKCDRFDIDRYCL